jgi:hypothetical protein
MMKTLLICSFFLSLNLMALPKDSTEYFGAKNQEAQFTFETQIFMPTSKGTPTNDLVKAEFKLYSKYMLGQMRRTPNNAAAVYPKFSINVNKVEKVSASFNRVYVQFTGKGVFSPGQTNYTFLIPNYTADIYKKSQGLCMEATNVDAGNFWYHWDPKKAGCPLVSGADYSEVIAPLNYIASTTRTYPEYEKLVRNGGLRMTIFFGLENYDEQDWNPNTNTKDWGGIGFRQQRTNLLNLGFQSYTWSEAEVRKWYNPEAGKPIPYLETMTKNTPRGPMTVRLFLGNTGLEHDARGFHAFLKDAIWNDASVIYNGHSGIGKNLDIPRIADTRGYKLPISNDYQVFFLGSCVPYSYYTEMLFKKKSSSTDLTGTKGLDIIAYGNESIFGNSDDIRLTIALMNYMDSGFRTSYQDIIGSQDSYFLGVSGDEDNPTN